MKEYVEKHVVVELTEKEDEAFNTVLDVLERMSNLYDEENVEDIFLKISQVGEVDILAGTAERCIEAIEEILGVWS